MVDEFQVVTSGGQAEFGRALGGYINVVTKSGTNTLHGDLYGYFRNQRFNAANALSNTALPLTQAQYGASLGGPIDPRPHVLLREFRAARTESVRPHHDLARQRRRHQRAARRRRLSGPADLDRPLSQSGPQHQFPGQGRSSVQRAATSSASATACTTSHSRNSRGAGGLSAASASAGLDNTDQTIAVSNIADACPRGR